MNEPAVRRAGNMDIPAEVVLVFGEVGDHDGDTGVHRLGDVQNRRAV
jgi:hypothetical protein